MTRQNCLFPAAETLHVTHSASIPKMDKIGHNCGEEEVFCKSARARVPFVGVFRIWGAKNILSVSTFFVSLRSFVQQLQLQSICESFFARESIQRAKTSATATKCKFSILLPVQICLISSSSFVYLSLEVALN